MHRWAAVKDTAPIREWIARFLLIQLTIHRDNVVIIDESGMKKKDVSISPLQFPVLI